MRKLSEFKESVDFVLTDIDDTLTEEGHLRAPAYKALWDLSEAGVHVIPITGRPAGWCEMIARQWPVAGVVGENGGFWFRYHQQKMKRDFFFPPEIIASNRAKLDQLARQIPEQVPGSALASDQFCRLMDLAIDFCEDVPPLSDDSVQKIVQAFTDMGAVAKVSSIHVNGWFGDYDKLKMSLRFLKSEFGMTSDEAQQRCAFVGDSPNDEPMFAFFPNSFGVANIQNFAKRLKHPPKFVAESRGGQGFVEVSRQILGTRRH